MAWQKSVRQCHSTAWQKSGSVTPSQAFLWSCVLRNLSHGMTLRCFSTCTWYISVCPQWEQTVGAAWVAAFHFDAVAHT